VSDFIGTAYAASGNIKDDMDYATGNATM